MSLTLDQIAALKWLLVEKIMNDVEYNPSESEFRTAIHDQIYAWKQKQSFVGVGRIKLHENRFLKKDNSECWALFGIRSDGTEYSIRLLDLFENNFINSAIAQVVENATHIQIPPPFHGQDNSDVAYAEGWNQACLNFFCNNQPPEPMVITIENTPEDTIHIQDAWLWAGGHPGIKATKQDVKFAIENLQEVADVETLEDSANPLYVFAQEVVFGAYKPEELANVAQRALQRYRAMK